MRRATKLRASLVKRRSAVLGRLDAYLELLGPGWHAAFGADLANNTPLRFLAAGYGDPHTLRRVGRARLIEVHLAALPRSVGRRPRRPAARGGR